jgi:hypothetical protein
MKAAFVYTAIGIVVVVVLLQLYFIREGFFASRADKLKALNDAITLCKVSGKTSDCKIAAGNGGDLSDGTNVPGVAMSLDSSDKHGCNSLDVSMNDNTYLTNVLRIRQVSNATILTVLKCIKAGFTASATDAAAAAAAAAAATAAAKAARDLAAAKAARDAAAAKAIKDAADAAAANVITTAKAASDAAAAATAAAAAYATAKAAADADPTNSAKATASNTAKAASDSAAALSVTAAQAAAAAAKVVKDAADAAAADAADDADADADDATDASGNLITLSLSDLFYALRFGNTNTETTKKTPTLLPKSTTHSFSEEEKNRLSKDIAKNIKDQLLSDRSLDLILPAPNDSCANESACVTDSCSQGADYMSGAPFNANDYIRKDSIPCYGCTLPK